MSVSVSTLEEVMYPLEKPTDCPICADTMENVATPIGPCGHWMHVECMKNCTKPECPICRAKVPVDVRGHFVSEDDDVLEEPATPEPHRRPRRRHAVKKSSERHMIENLYGSLISYGHLSRHNEFYELDVEFLEQLLEMKRISRVEVKACMEAVQREEEFHR